MKKFKKVLLGALSVLTFGIFAVTTTKVDAQSYSIGTVNTDTTTSANDTKIWTFTGSSTASYNTGDDINGIYVFKGNSTVSSNSGDGLRLYTDASTNGGNGGSYIYVPIPSNTTSGSLTILWTSNNSSRGLYLVGESTNTYILSSKTAPGAVQSFTSDNILSDNTYGTYLKLYSYATDGTSKENKIGSIKSVVVGDSYTPIAQDVNVNIYDGENLLKTEIVKEGSYLDYTPIKLGYTFNGFYTDAELTSEFDNENTPITSSITTLYAKFTKKANYTVNDANYLNQNIVDTIHSEIGTDALVTDLPVTDTIFTVLNNCKMQTSNSVNCIGTNSSLSTTKNGIKIEVPSSGYLTVVLTTSGGSSRDAKLINSSSTEVIPSYGVKSWTADEASEYLVRTIIYSVQSGTYYLGGSNGMRIFGCKFSESLEAVSSVGVQTGTSTTNDGTSAIRSVLAVELKDSNVEISSVTCRVYGYGTDNKGLNSTSATSVTMYTSLYGDITGCNEKDNTFYTYYSLYGLTDTYNNYYVKFEYVITFSNDLVITNSISSKISV